MANGKGGRGRGMASKEALKDKWEAPLFQKRFIERDNPGERVTWGSVSEVTVWACYSLACCSMNALPHPWLRLCHPFCLFQHFLGWFVNSPLPWLQRFHLSFLFCGCLLDGWLALREVSTVLDFKLHQLPHLIQGYFGFSGSHPHLTHRL